MVITNDVNLPTCEELTVPEVNVSIVTLMAAAPYLGQRCEAVNNEFMLCRQERGDPRACVGLGKLVTECTMCAFKEIKRNCKEAFNQYANCVDKSSGDYRLKHCRKTQAIFDNCMKEKLCVSRPDFGHFCRGRVHKSPYPAQKPPSCPCHPKVLDPTPSLPDCAPRPPPRFGGRYYWFDE